MNSHQADQNEQEVIIERKVECHFVIFKLNKAEQFEFFYMNLKQEITHLFNFGYRLRIVRLIRYSIAVKAF